MKAGESQAEKLPVTTSSIITESKGTFLGLDGIGFLYVVGAFVSVILLSYIIPIPVFQDNSFPVAAAAAVAMYLVMRLYIRGKPDGFLNDALMFNNRPKIFEHRPRGKRPILKEEMEKQK